jgi:hypothetical protein
VDGTPERYATFGNYFGGQLRVPNLVMTDANIGIHYLR